MLVYFLEKNEKIAEEWLKNKNVLELGSGTGILGLAVACFETKAIYLSDLE